MYFFVILNFKDKIHFKKYAAQTEDITLSG
jgi:hypothetical protein